MIHSKYLKFKIWLIFVLKVTHYILHDLVDCAHACPLLQIVAPPPSPLELQTNLSEDFIITEKAPSAVRFHI